MLHRLRQDLAYQRTALTNQIRGFLSELGVVIPQSINQIRSIGIYLNEPWHKQL